MLELNLTKNTNEAIQGTYGKYYARVEYKDTIGIDKLAKHMHSHNAVWSRGLVVGLLTDLVDCVKELALQGYVVKIDDLGLFKATVEGNGLTLQQGAKISAGRGVQRKDSELQADITLQQFAVKNVKLLVQATGETTIDNMNGEASTQFTSKAKALVLSLTGSESNAPANTGGGTSPNPSQGGENNGGGNGGGGDNNGGGGGGGEDGDAI
jgi:hypothetical protein